MDLATRISPGLEERGGIWLSADTHAGEPWSALAQQNSIHAAISVRSEQAEEQKSQDAIDQLDALVGADDVMLDVGCGYGRLSKYLLARKPIAGYIGVDGSPEMLRQFRTRYDDSPLEQRTPHLLLQGPIDRIRLHNSSVDVAVIAGVLLHNPKDVVHDIVAEVRRVLRPGGRLIVQNDLPNLWGGAALQGNLYLAWLRLRGQAKRNGPLRYYRYREVVDLLDGFELDTVQRNGFGLFAKTLLGGDRSTVGRTYRKLAERANEFVGKLLPDRVVQHLYVHLTLVATRR